MNPNVITTAETRTLWGAFDRLSRSRGPWSPVGPEERMIALLAMGGELARRGFPRESLGLYAP